MTSTAVTTFAFNLSPIRVLEIDGSQWFVAADVCRALAMSLEKGTTKHLQRLSESEKRAITRRTSPEVFGGDRATTHTIISERGLAKVVTGSTKPVAREFQAWLTRVVFRKPVACAPKASTPKNELITLHEIDGAPLVLDTDLAERLGMSRSTNIRGTIEANREELEGYGTLHSARATSRMPNGGSKIVAAFYLNEEQALLICMLSRTPTAKAIRREVIAVYQAWRKGKLQPAAPAMPAIPQDFASALRLAADEHEKRVALEVTLKVTQDDLAEKTEKVEALVSAFGESTHTVAHMARTLGAGVNINRVKESLAPPR